MGKDYPEKTSFSWYLPSMQPTGTSKAEAQCLTTPLPLTKYLGQKLPICQLLDLDPGGVWESMHKFSAKSVGGNGPFCKMCVFA